MLQQVKITHVTRLIQGKTTLYSFPIAPDVLLQMGTVLRFGEHPEGVNRAFTTGHANSIARFMREDPSPVFMENICGDLRASESDGGWIFNEEEGTLTGMVESDEEARLDGCCLVVDDGQHRMGALEMLNGDERARFQMLVTATMGASVEQRLTLFRQQTKEMRQSRRLQYAVDYKRKALPHTDRVAYEIALRLNTDPASPLKDKIYFGQDPRVPKGTMNILGLISFLKACVGRTSLLFNLKEEEQKDIVFNFLYAASEQWSSVWGRLDKTLGRSVGICALIRQLSHGGRMHKALQGDYSLSNLKTVLSHGTGFKWETKFDDKGINPTTTASRLDEYIGSRALATAAPE